MVSAPARPAPDQVSAALDAELSSSPELDGCACGFSGASGQPTINDVARLACVSKKTVSRVLNEPTRVEPLTRQRVLEMISRSGYVPDPLARSLARRRGRHP